MLRKVSAEVFLTHTLFCCFAIKWFKSVKKIRKENTEISSQGAQISINRIFGGLFNTYQWWHRG